MISPLWIASLLASSASLVRAETPQIPCGTEGLPWTSTTTGQTYGISVSQVQSRINDCGRRKVPGGSLRVISSKFRWNRVANFKDGLAAWNEVWLDKTPYPFRTDGSPDAYSRRLLIWGDHLSMGAMTLGQAIEHCRRYMHAPNEPNLNFRLPTFQELKTGVAHGLRQVSDFEEGQYWVGDQAADEYAPLGRMNRIKNYFYLFFDPAHPVRQTTNEFWVQKRNARCVAEYQL